MTGVRDARCRSLPHKHWVAKNPSCEFTFLLRAHAVKKLRRAQRNLSCYVVRKLVIWAFRRVIALLSVQVVGLSQLMNPSNAAICALVKQEWTLTSSVKKAVLVQYWDLLKFLFPRTSIFFRERFGQPQSNLREDYQEYDR